MSESPETSNNDELKAPHPFPFPFTPYNIQQDFMKTLYETIEQKKLGIFESPTGTGKSLSIACSSIQWLKDNEMRNLDSLIKKIDEISIKQENCANNEDWITGQYISRLQNDQKNKLVDELNFINNRLVEINNIKTKHKSEKLINKAFLQKTAQKISNENDQEDAEFILEGNDYLEDEKEEDIVLGGDKECSQQTQED